VALVVAVMMVMMVVGRWVAVTGVAAPFSPAPPLGATVASEWLLAASGRRSTGGFL
tara:strand:- start:171 stop:338 length:168 start_codon:yes stop_codon:yes gene_type:complete